MRTSVNYESLGGHQAIRTFQSAKAALDWIDNVEPRFALPLSDANKTLITGIDYYYTATNFVTLTRRELSRIIEDPLIQTYISGLPAVQEDAP
jgi:hypothetical protein